VPWVLILRDTEQLTPVYGLTTATTWALLLSTGYNAAATAASLPAGWTSARPGGQ
jgi:hypothetical protein